MPSPQSTQSCGQLKTSSLAEHTPSSQRVQSSKQVSSVSGPVQRPSPQTLQSPGHVFTVSERWQMPSPQRRQSEGHVSFGSQTLLQMPRQSDAQLPRVSTPSHKPLPHTLGKKQSRAQESWSSLSKLHTPSPHEPQSVSHSSSTSHTPSHVLGTKQSTEQLTLFSEAEHRPSPQPEGAQSAGQPRAFSDAAHLPSPQLDVVEQSAGQVRRLSLPSQSPSPQVARQSTLQLWPPSLLLQTLSPQLQSLEQFAEFSAREQISSPHSADWSSFSPSGARPQAPTTPAPARSSAPQRNRAHATRVFDSTERVCPMILPIETRPPTRRKRRRRASVSFPDRIARSRPTRRVTVIASREPAL